MGVVVRRDDGHEMTVKGNDGSGWSSDGVVLWLGRRQNEDAVEWWYGFNNSILAHDEKRWDKVLLEDKAETVSSS
jgi:hypothetical protein